MTDLKQALVDIRNIRGQVANATEFRGYGPLTLSMTVLLALLAGVAQTRVAPEPMLHPSRYVALWLGTGVVCAALIAVQMWARARRMHSEMADEMVRSAVAQFLPAAAAGVALPFVLLHVAGNLCWLLPGLWQILFSLGVFACCRSLPRPMMLVGGWFLASGFFCLALGERALAPATMAAVYGFGMALTAVLHYRSARKAGENDEAGF